MFYCRAPNCTWSGSSKNAAIKHVQHTHEGVSHVFQQVTAQHRQSFDERKARYLANRRNKRGRTGASEEEEVSGLAANQGLCLRVATRTRECACHSNGSRGPRRQRNGANVAPWQPVLIRIHAELLLCVPRPQEAESQNLVSRLGKSQVGIG